MKKKGFTLIELLGAITLVAVISLLAIPPIINQINKSKETLSDSLLQIIYNATDLYVNAYNKDYIKEEGNVYCVTLKELVDNDFLQEPIIDPKSNSTISLDKKVEASVVSGNYNYKMNDECTRIIN